MSAGGDANIEAKLADPNHDAFTIDMPNECTYKANEFVAVVTMNRPEAKNALDASVSQGLMIALKRIQQSPQLRVVFLTGNGNMFSAGGDPKEFQRVRAHVHAFHVRFDCPFIIRRLPWLRLLKRR